MPIFHVLRLTESHPRFTEETLPYITDLLENKDCRVRLKWAGYSSDGRYRQWIATSVFGTISLIQQWSPQ